MNTAPPPRGPAVTLLCTVCNGHGSQGCPYPNSHPRCPRSAEQWPRKEGVSFEEGTEMKGPGALCKHSGPGFALLTHISCRAAETLSTCYQPRQALWECSFSRGQGQISLCRLGVGSSCTGPTPSGLSLQGRPAQGLGGTAGVPWHCTMHPHPAGPTPCSLYPFTSHLGTGHPGKPDACCLLEDWLRRALRSPGGWLLSHPRSK